MKLLFPISYHHFHNSSQTITTQPFSSSPTHPSPPPPHLPVKQCTYLLPQSETATVAGQIPSSILLSPNFSVFGHFSPAPTKDKVSPPWSKLTKSGGGKQNKKKRSKGKHKEKVNNMVLFEQGTYDKLLSEAPKEILVWLEPNNSS
ncbi:40S ribosomal protein S25-2 [Linum perenne]